MSSQIVNKELKIRFRQLEWLIIAMAGATLATLQIIRYVLLTGGEQLTIWQTALDWIFAMSIITGLVHFSFRVIHKTQYELLTKREQANKAEKRLQHIFDMTEDTIFVINKDGRFTFASKSVETLTGYPLDDIMGGMNILDILTAEYRSYISRQLNEYKNLGGRHLYLDVLKKRGGTVPIELSFIPIKDQSGQLSGFQGIAHDITMRRKAEAEKKELECKAQASSRLASVGEMAAGIAHEINNPLTGVIGYADLLMQREGLPADIRSELEIINSGAQRVADIVKRLLIFARQEKPKRCYVNANEIINSTLLLRAYSLRTNNIALTMELEPQLPVTVADGSQLQQVFLNIIVNAETEMKLSHGKGNLLIKTEQVDGHIKIAFTDDGPGIAPENLPKIFEPFFTTREVGHGTGLGLSVCHGIVTEHNGRIYVESEFGKGATFIVELPIFAESKESEPAENNHDDIPKSKMAKILVVDDEEIIRQFLSRVLTGEGYQVLTADGHVDALKKIESQRPDLILLDIKMPGEGGFELYQHIGKMFPELAPRMLFITGDTMGVDTEKFLADHKVPAITKPIDIGQLRKEISRFFV